jgi:Tfp pilus assembly protein PilW
MDFKTMSIKSRAAGFTLFEVLISAGISSLLMLVLASFSLITARDCAALANYADLESQSRLGLDTLTRHIRQARGLISATSTNLIFNDADGGNLEFAYVPGSKTFVCIKNGVTTVLLKDCERINWDTFQRNPIAGRYDAYPVATPGTCKLVQFTWVCSRSLLGSQFNSQSVQSAKIVLRKQH